MERRQKNLVGFGRPLGTDGFDYSYRMTVNQRYQKVALRKAQLYRLFIAQVACQALGILWVALVMLKGRQVSNIVLLSITSGIIAITSGEIGRRRTNSMLLMLYISTSSFATALSVICGSLGHLSGEPTVYEMSGNKRSSAKEELVEFLQLSPRKRRSRSIRKSVSPIPRSKCTSPVQKSTPSFPRNYHPRIPMAHKRNQHKLEQSTFEQRKWSDYLKKSGFAENKEAESSLEIQTRTKKEIPCRFYSILWRPGEFL